MEFSGEYLTYEEYKALGGTLDLLPFNLLEFEARKKINLKTFNRLVGIKEIPQEVTKINHIDNDMVKDSPRVSEVLPSFEEFVGNCPVIAHNLEFDLKFLYYSGRSFFEEKRKFYDTLEQAQKLLRKANSRYEAEEEYDVENYKLATLCEFFNITIPCKHRAAADAIATGKLFLALVEEKQSR